jgi:DNA-binding transcriptional regulator YiaG
VKTPPGWEDAKKEWFVAQKEQDELKVRKFRRQRSGLSQFELATLLHISRSKLRDFEIGVGKLTAEEHGRWDYELGRRDPWFKFQVADDYARKASAREEERQKEIADLRSQIATMQARLDKLSDRFEEALTMQEAALKAWEKSGTAPSREAVKLTEHSRALAQKK